MEETERVRCDGCGTEVVVTHTVSPQMAAVLRAAYLDRQLAASGWVRAGVNDFCPDCIEAGHPSAVAPRLRIVRDED